MYCASSSSSGRTKLQHNPSSQIAYAVKATPNPFDLPNSKCRFANSSLESGSGIFNQKSLSYRSLFREYTSSLKVQRSGKSKPFSDKKAMNDSFASSKLVSESFIYHRIHDRGCFLFAVWRNEEVSRKGAKPRRIKGDAAGWFWVGKSEIL